ncbi:uncharacterized protein LOC130803998 isoform X2 [Amaranthus tricolor]|uniref:uncharacterized protein LOC130803998 isoform X2 n=1 Tax=Amaranthus tricolor TaxID=29722 RepID=UPI00258C07FB|nr:uncharacterized protein LOC130803998 isoform X2 [Amaranthus tricolor]
MSTNLRVGVGDGGWSEEYDCVPLRLRLKMLHLIKHQKEFVKVKSEPQTICGCFAESETVTEKQLIQSANCSSMVLFAKDLELRIQQASDSRADRYEECPKDYGLSQFENCFISSSKVLASEAQADTEQLKDLAGASLHRTTSDVPHNILQDCLMSYTSESGQASDVKQEIFYDFDDTLDNILLKERRKMLLFRKFMESSRSNAEEQDDGGLSTFSKVMLQSAGNDFIRDVVIENNIDHEVNGYENLGSEIATDGTFHTSKYCSSSLTESLVSIKSIPLTAGCKSFCTQETTIVETSVLPSLAKVKDEPVDINEQYCEGNNVMPNSYIDQTLSVKNEPVFSEFILDELDHLPLAYRVKFLSSGIPSSDASGTPEIMEDGASAMEFGSDVFESVKSISMSRPKKKRRTATDSVETALEEDAPGLLKVLLDRGVLAEEIKLYGEANTDDALDDSIGEVGFAELEAVISQLFWQRQTFLKFPHLRSKGAKIDYCLSCLLSLVEQTRYLRNKKWPIEWGWCRDLQSFIFVFQRHNRIVLERPEYGFATYFFELLNSVPVAWQIKRLVTAMKLTSCGRITLIENRPLVRLQ